MRRRNFLQGAGLALSGGLTGGLAAPSLALAQDSKVLRFVPQANLANLDPIWGTQQVVRNASWLIWDTLYALDSSLEPRPQMVEAHENTPDFKSWTFRLRPRLKFHDGEPVLSKDVVASLSRWMQRDTMGVMIKRQLDALEAVDDRTFRFRLNQPFSKMLLALGKTNAPVPFIMPERIAKTDPYKQIEDYVGSGPMTFRKDEWVPGSLAVFHRFDGYQPRPEPANWQSGGKRMLLDRIEWRTVPDAATAAAALQNGEVDWWETPIPDLIPVLKGNRNVVVDVADPLGNVSAMRLNHLQPPFNDVRVRRALQLALDQADMMGAVVGDDALWKPMPGFFTPGTPLYTEAGGEPLKGPRRYDAAKQLLAEAKYDGTPVVLLVATDVPVTKALGDVTADVLQKIGMKVDYQALDWGTVGQRRAKRDAPNAGGWNIFHTWFAGVDCVNPSYTGFDASGSTAWFGWPNSPDTQAGIAEWFAAPDLAGQKQAAAKANAAAIRDVVYLPCGFYLAYQAWRRNVQGVGKAPFPVFWDVSKG